MFVTQSVNDISVKAVVHVYTDTSSKNLSVSFGITNAGGMNGKWFTARLTLFVINPEPGK